MLLTLAAIAVVAFFIGSWLERAREAHTMFNSYKRRVASMRGVRIKETTKVIVGIAALMLLLEILSNLPE